MRPEEVSPEKDYLNKEWSAEGVATIAIQQLEQRLKIGDYSYSGARKHIAVGCRILVNEKNMYEIFDDLCALIEAKFLNNGWGYANFGAGKSGGGGQYEGTLFLGAMQ